MMRFGIGAGEDERRDPVGEHRRLARARAGDDEQRPGPLGLADPVLDRELLLGVELDGGRRANQGERHGPNATMFRALFARRWTACYSQVGMSPLSRVEMSPFAEAEGGGFERGRFGDERGGAGTA